MAEDEQDGAGLADAQVAGERAHGGVFCESAVDVWNDDEEEEGADKAAEGDEEGCLGVK